MEKAKVKSWEEMTKVEKVRNVGCLAVVGAAILAIIIAFFSSVIKDNAEEKRLTVAGLDPVSTYIQLEDMGFQMERTSDVEYGTSWNCTRVDYGISYLVTIYAPFSAKYAQSIRLSVMVEPGIENISKGMWMMKKLSTVYYDTYSPSAADWVEANYNNDGATIIFGDAEFTINAPSDYVRMLTINKKISSEAAEE